MTNEEYNLRIKDMDMDFSKRTYDLQKDYSDRRNELYEEWQTTKCAHCNHPRNNHLGLVKCFDCDCKEFVEVTEKELA